MENILKLYTYVDGVNDTPFPSEEEQVQIIDFKFEASRMAGAPTIEAAVKHILCLDNLWSDKVYASYRGEKYYVRNTPSSSKDNTDERYSHNVELMSERDVLNHVYFIDAVQGDSGIDKVKSNSPRVQFYGDIKEFVGRLNSSLEYAKLDYTAVIDEGIESEIVNVSFEDKYILESLQESVNIFEIPYYFVGKTIHFGYMENAIPYEMEYGNEGALLSISKENANYKAVNRVSGTGSTGNIPYYYPNTSPNGDIYCEPILGNTGITSSSDITVINPELFASKISVNDVLTCFLFDAEITSNNAKSTIEGIDVVKIDEVVDLNINVSSPGYVSLNISYLPNIVIDSPLLFTYTSNPKVTLAGSSVDVLSFDADTITFMAKEAGEYSVHFETTTTLITDKYMELKVTVNVSIKGLGFQLVKEGDNVEVYNENEIGLSFNKQPNSGDKIKQSVKALIPFSQTLMPPVYRETSGAERFYNAKNNTYEIPVEGGYYNFENEYSDNNRKEIIVDFSEIKPSIVGMTNKEGLRIDMFSDFAFDKNDSDEYDSVNNEYLHPYFYGKLRKFDGDYGFNLFDHAQEGSTMTVSMTSGVCGACNFEIGVGDETNKNIIQVDENGDLIYDEDGKVKTGEPQEKQNDTRTNEVWIALKKDDTTYPSFKPMPNATGNLKPSAGDTFVLTGINMPQSYIEKAENDLKEAIIKYMWLNNTDKFNFSIKFSRIFLKEHPEILDKLNENARIVVKYNNSTYTFYVDNFSVNVNSSEPLPEIEVNLVDTLTIGKNSLQNALDSVKQDILSTMGGGDFLKQGLKYFIRKDVDDYANGKLRLKGGVSIEKNAIFGKSGFSGGMTGVGGRIDEMANAEFESLTLRKFLEVPEIRYNRAQILLGDQWNAPGCGIVEIVRIDKENGEYVNTGIISLKLENGEIGAVDIDDICMGYFHNINGDNSTEDVDDSKGNRQFSGFSTVYFRITEILSSDNKIFKYELREQSENWKYSNHPFVGMHFVCYGNFTNKDRQTSAYQTRTYQRYLKNVDDWEFRYENIAMQNGDLSNLNVFGIDLKGYSLFVNNIYIKGTIQNIRDDGEYVNIVNDRGAWEDGVFYKKNDRVSHDGRLWLCVDENGTESEPSLENSSWLLQVDKGDSITSIGAWKDGVLVKKGNVVTMGGNSFLAKNDTYNPPMYTLLTKNGERILANTKNGLGYILTGEINLDEYDIIAEKGEDGENGLEGCLTRESKWQEGVEYRNDSGLSGLRYRYIDVVVVPTRINSPSGWDIYLCKKTHVSSSDITVYNTEYWRQLSNVDPIYTSLIIAKNAKIEFFQGNELVITKIDDDGNYIVTAGMSGSEDGNKTRIWAGSDDKDNAPFRVNEKGEMFSSNSHVEGYIKADTGELGNVVISDKDSESGIYYKSTNVEGYETMLAMRPKQISALPYNVFDLQPSASPMNVLMWLKRRRNNNLDRALYVEGVMEVFGRLGVGIGGNTGFLDGKPALVTEGIANYKMEIIGPVQWKFTENGTIPVSGARIIYVTGNTGSDNPCYIDNGEDGQVITIINTSESHRVNVKGTGTRDIWIREGEAKTFYYLSAFNKWFQERFDW